jgi:hypothetical protein
LGANYVTSSFFYSSTCNPEGPVLLAAYIISTLNFVRLMNRVVEFKKFNFIVTRCTKFFFHYIPAFLLFGVMLATICFSSFHDQVQSCHDVKGQELLSRQACTARGLALHPFKINFDSIQESLFSYYVLIDRSLWYDVLPMALGSQVLHSLYKAALFVILYVLFAFGTFLLRGVTLAICYVSLEKFASVRMDKNITLTKPQVEWIQTEELFSDIELLRKLPTPSLRISKLCLTIKESTQWAVIYYFVIIAGFLFNVSE